MGASDQKLHSHLLKLWPYQIRFCLLLFSDSSTKCPKDATLYRMTTWDACMTWTLKWDKRVCQSLFIINLVRCFQMCMQSHSIVHIFFWLFVVDYSIQFIFNIVKILSIYIIIFCTHLYHFFPVSIHYLQCIHCLLHYMWRNI